MTWKILGKQLNVSSRTLHSLLHFREISQFYIHDVVLDNVFDECGVDQLSVDVRIGILPIFRQFAFDPDRASLKSITEMIALLEARRPNAMLLADSIRSVALPEQFRTKVQ